MSSHLKKKNALTAVMGAAQKATKKVGHKKKKKSLKTYFPPKVNSLGYPMKSCKFQPSEGQYMYQPWWYGQMYAEDPQTEGIYPLYCRHCKLQPCVAVENHVSSSMTGYYCLEEEKKPKPTVRLIIANRLEMHRRRVFDLDYGAPPSHTKCMTEYVNWRIPDKDRDSYWNPEEQDRANGVALPVGLARIPPGKWDKDYVEKKEEPLPCYHWHGPGKDSDGYVEKKKMEEPQKDEPRFHYGDTTDSDDNSSNDDIDDDDIPLALLRNHEPGDVSLKEKVKSYRKNRAKQLVADHALKVNNSGSKSAKESNRETKSEESSDEEWEF